jgi:hypothetical protein
MAYSVEVCVPESCVAGETFVVTTTDGQELDVVVPAGCSGGSMLMVDVPYSEPAGPSVVEVAVPDGLAPGDSFIVDIADGRSLDVIVPDGCASGDLLFIDVPALPPPDSQVAGPTRVGSRVGSRRGSRALLELPPGFGGVLASGLPTALQPERGGAFDGGPSEALPAQGQKKREGIKVALNLGGGVSLKLSLGPQGKYKIDQKVEVERSDGTWSGALVKVCKTHHPPSKHALVRRRSPCSSSMLSG